MYGSVRRILGLGESMDLVWAWYKLHEVMKGGLSLLGSGTKGLVSN